MGLYANWRDQVVFSKDGPQPQVLIETDKFKSVLVGLEAGQKLPYHPGGAAIYHFLEGTGWVTVNGDRQAIQSGATVTMSEGAERSIEATTRLAFIAARTMP
jgi:quercetin dioxygenase-like cupin family protein